MRWWSLTTSRLAASSRTTFKSMSSSTSDQTLPLLRGVIFDMDGTLTIPNLDFVKMYSRCGVPLSEDLLLAIKAMDSTQAAAAHAVIDEMEEEGRRTLKLATGVVSMAKWLSSHGVRTALVTRNTATTVSALEENLWFPSGLSPFDLTISRDSHPDLKAKPDPSSMLFIAEKWGMNLPSNELLMVGDSPSIDIVFGRQAGVATALVDTGRRYLEETTTTSTTVGGSGGGGADLCVEHLGELPRLLWSRFNIPGPLGTGMPLRKYAAPTPTSPAEEAAARGDAKALETCLGATPSPAAADGNRTVAALGHGENTLLIWAADGGHPECVKLLLELKCQLDGPAAAGAAAGGAAGHNNENDIGRIDIDAQGFLGATAVCRAARKGHVEVVEALLAAGANPNIPNVKLQHPLHFAAFKKHPTVVQALLVGGADPLVLDRKGRTPAWDTSEADIRNVLLAAEQSFISTGVNGAAAGVKE
jgi:phosphoglycolate phosphatase-like HAD superfamily hydrolase